MKTYYINMPDSWALANYGKNKFALIQNILELSKQTYPFIHIKAGGVVYLPLPWQFYHGIVMSTHWKLLRRLYKVNYITYKDAQLHPLVRSDLVIKDTIAICGKSVDRNLELLTMKGEKFESLITGDTKHWRGKDDVFMKLTRK